METGTNTLQNKYTIYKCNLTVSSIAAMVINFVRVFLFGRKSFRFQQVLIKILSSELNIFPQLVLALVTTRLDYCNSVLAALPHCTVEPLSAFKIRPHVGSSI